MYMCMHEVYYMLHMSSCMYMYTCTVQDFLMPRVKTIFILVYNFTCISELVILPPWVFSMDVTRCMAVCRACECKISEMVEFLNSDREHMQQGIFPDVQQSYLLHSALNFDEVSLTQCTFIILTCNLVTNHFSHAMNVIVYMYMPQVS